MKDKCAVYFSFGLFKSHFRLESLDLLLKRVYIAPE